MRRLRSAMLGLAVFAAAGCKDQLVVENVNSPEIERALARPTDVEAFVSGQFRLIHNALWTTGGINPQLVVAGMESYSGNANFGMNVRANIPRSGIDNNRGNPTDYFATYNALTTAARSAALALSRLDQPSFTFFPPSAAQTQRARAFAYFIMGVSQGYLAMMFDSAPVIERDDDITVPKPLVGPDSAMRASLSFLDSAIAIASLTPSGANGFPIPNTGPSWLQMPAATTISGGATGLFARLAHSYKARFRAGVARTPVERAAVDWNAVIASATAGITSNVDINYIAASGWTYGSGTGPAQMATYQSWHQMWQGIVLMADTSGNFLAWLNESANNKSPKLVLTSDNRFPAGTTRAAQNAASGCTTGASCTTPAGQYFRNRLAGNDVAVAGLYHSYYDYHRFQSFFTNNSIGTVPLFVRAELDMLMAEGHIRLGNLATATALINASRTARALAPIATPAAVLDPITTTTGAACVPRVPTGPTNPANMTPTAVACGNIMEAMKWEKRMETAFISPGGWFFDGRGWGDLPANTPINYPVPFTDLDSRRQPIYSIPTVNPFMGNAYTAAERLSNSTSNYGYGH
jgi:hypothetical protein